MYVKRSSLENYFLFPTNKQTKSSRLENDDIFHQTFPYSVGILLSSQRTARISSKFTSKTKQQPLNFDPISASKTLSPPSPGSTDEVSSCVCQSSCRVGACGPVYNCDKRHCSSFHEMLSDQLWIKSCCSELE